jgi:probable phosphoglycerate mutase
MMNKLLAFGLSVGLFSLSMMSVEATTIYLVRHAQTDWNLNHRIQSSQETSINATGVEQAHCLAEKFKEIPFKAVVTSGKKRTNETATILIAGKPLGIKYDRRVAERDYGKWEGKDKAEFHHAQAEEKVHVEGNDRVISRVFSSFNSIAEEYPEGNVLVVTHGSVLKNIVASLKKLPIHSVKAENTGYVILTQSNGEWEIKEMQGILLNR